jgi:hypothetical protein
VVLFFDGHGSHLTFEVASTCKKNNVSCDKKDNRPISFSLLDIFSSTFHLDHSGVHSSKHISRSPTFRRGFLSPTETEVEESFAYLVQGNKVAQG